MVDNVARSKLLLDILNGNAHLHHHNEDVIGKVADLVDGLCLIVCLARDNDLGAFLANLLKNFINSLFKEVGGVRALLLLGLSALDKLHKRIKGETALSHLGILPNGIFKAREAAGVTSRAVGLNDDLERILVAICGDGHDMLEVSAGLALEPKLLP